MRYRILIWLLLLMASPVVAQEVNSNNDELIIIEEEDTLEADTLELTADTLTTDKELTWPENIAQKLQFLLRSKMFRTSQVGMMVYDLTADSAIFCHNEKQLMRPASTMKMINAVTAIDRLGDSFAFRTHLMWTGKQDSTTIRGNLYLKGGMDPLFGNDDMRSFVSGLRQMNIDTIRGQIYADLSMKDSNRWGEGWCWDDDNPDLSPLLVEGKNTFMQRFCQELKSAGIVFIGDTLRGSTPTNARLICTQSHTFSQVLQRMMKNSNNQFAECMFYQLAASAKAKGPATAKGARKVIESLVKKMGMNPKNYYFADGSGLSLYNYVSPELEVRFLRYAYDNENIFPSLLPSLPVAGVDGTLAKRMVKGNAKGNVKAKTGTVMGVSALAGYCTAANGHYLCFSIINMGNRKTQTGRAFQDRVCEVLCSQ